MSLASLTSERVRLAVAEFDELGRGDFLRKYGFSKAKSYFLKLGDNFYDSKAIVGCALGLSAREFSGGDATVARRLATLGFHVQRFPLVPWKSEEVILACAVVEANRWKQPVGQRNDWQVIEISELLQTALFHPLEQHGPDFRDPGDVARTMADIVARHSDYRGASAGGDDLVGDVVLDFVERPGEMHAEAARLRALILGVDRSVVPVRQPSVDGPIVFDVPVEAHHTVRYQVRARADDGTAVRREAELVMRYQRWSQANGHRVIGKDILLPGRRNPLRVDLYDVDSSELIEAKASAERDSVRLGLGQVLDYARYVHHERRAVLLPTRPDADLIDLLVSHGVSCVYETAVGLFERVEHRQG